MGTFIVIAVLAILAYGIYIGIKKSKEQEAAKQRYLQSLADLKQSPTDADLKQHALALGRAYSNLTRDKKGVALFDEVALMNDINAACAGATKHWGSDAQPSPSSSGESIEARLRTLTTLKEKGLIESVEYDKRRAEILGSI